MKSFNESVDISVPLLKGSWLDVMFSTLAMPEPKTKSAKKEPVDHSKRIEALKKISVIKKEKP